MESIAAATQAVNLLHRVKPSTQETFKGQIDRNTILKPFHQCKMYLNIGFYVKLVYLGSLMQLDYYKALHIHGLLPSSTLWSRHNQSG